MVKKVLQIGLFFLIIYVPLSFSQYVPGKNYLGPSIGISFLGSAAQIGGNYEYSKEIENFGMIGFGGILRYFSYSTPYFEGKWSYTNVLIAAQGNYHFKINENEKIDPFAGVILGYDASSISWSGSNKKYIQPSGGGLLFALNGGARYWFTPSVAISGRIGFGALSYGMFDVGVDFKF